MGTAARWKEFSPTCGHDDLFILARCRAHVDTRLNGGCILTSQGHVFLPDCGDALKWRNSLIRSLQGQGRLWSERCICLRRNEARVCSDKRTRRQVSRPRDFGLPLRRVWWSRVRRECQNRPVRSKEWAVVAGAVRAWVDQWRCRLPNLLMASLEARCVCAIVEFQGQVSRRQGWHAHADE